MFLLFCITNLCFDSYYDIRGKIPFTPDILLFTHHTIL